MKRYEKLLLEAEKGITFEVSEGTSGELIIRALNIATTNVDLSHQDELTEKCAELQTESAGEYAKLQAISAGEYANTLSVYTDNDGNKAVVPPGWTVSGVCKENTIWGKDVSLVIYRIPKKKVSDINWEDMDVVEGLKRTYDQLVWVPVGLLDANGTLDGVSFTEKFGRRNYRNDRFSEGEFHEPLTGELALQAESVKKYGGFYISRYDISRNKKTGKPQSIKDEIPWTNINSNEAQKVAAMLETSDTITSHSTFGAEYDSVEEWFIKSKARTLKEIAEDSTNWGNHWNTENSLRKVVETGSSEEWCTNNIYDFAGNVDEWTQEQNDSSHRVIRGGGYGFNGCNYPVACRNYCNPGNYCHYTGFRATLYIK